MIDVKNALKITRKYYDEKTFYHAMRVAAYAANNNLIPPNKKEMCVVIAMMHDLLEDTKFNLTDYLDYYDMDECHMIKCIELLSKKEDIQYSDYLRDIKENYENYPEAYWVKLADMKDHLNQKETLTETLKEKYLNSIAELM